MWYTRYVMSLFEKQNKISHTLIFSLKSSSIDLQLVKILPNKKREVLFSVRKIIFLENSQDALVYTKQYNQELQDILNQNNLAIKKNLTNTPYTIQIILYAPWFTSKINSIVEEKTTHIDQKFVQTRIDDFKIPEHLVTVEKIILKTQVNGYTLSEFTDMKASNIKIDFYASYISKTILQSFLKIIKNHFPGVESIQVHTSPILFLERIKEFMIREDNVTVLYIGGEITEISIIKDDTLIFFATFPIGKHDFLRILKSRVKTYDYDLFNQNQIKIKSKVVEKTFEDAKKQWAHTVCTLLQNFQKQIPSKLLVISDTKSKQFFIDTINQSIQENQDSILKNHRIINFDISNFKDIISYNISNTEEIDLILEALM